MVYVAENDASVVPCDGASVSDAVAADAPALVKASAQIASITAA